jgi:murein DD-endopeptidase MepM/ murein hydrolase activator NlpD
MDERTLCPLFNRNPNLNHILNFAERNLTPISIGVLLLGVGLMIGVGPGKGLLDGSSNLNLNEPAEADVTDGGQTEPLGFNQGTGGGSAGVEPVYERAPVPFTIIPNRQRDEVVAYTIQPGDTVFGLADQFGLDMETIFWSNSDTLQDNVHLLVPGVDIFILPVNGIYYRATGEETVVEIAEKFFADPNDILTPGLNELPPASTSTFVPPLGMRLVVPGGVREAIDFEWAVPVAGTAGGSGSASQSVYFAPGQPGSCNVAIGGGAGTGAFGRPINAYNISQGYFFGHNGIDLSSTVGEPVYAADSGQVVFAGWSNWGYGNLVAVNHGAWTTLYGHLNGVTVGCGSNVSRGAQVGTVGSTGNSSGPHLHFEMRYGQVLNPDNPSSYIGF